MNLSNVKTLVWVIPNSALISNDNNHSLSYLTTKRTEGDAEISMQSN